jgi:hypothetical protein
MLLIGFNFLDIEAASSKTLLVVSQTKTERPIFVKSIFKVGSPMDVDCYFPIVETVNSFIGKQDFVAINCGRGRNSITWGISNIMFSINAGIVES